MLWRDAPRGGAWKFTYGGDSFQTARERKGGREGGGCRPRQLTNRCCDVNVGKKILRYVMSLARPRREASLVEFVFRVRRACKQSRVLNNLAMRFPASWLSQRFSFLVFSFPGSLPVEPSHSFSSFSILIDDNEIVPLCFNSFSSSSSSSSSFFLFFFFSLFFPFSTCRTNDSENLKARVEKLAGA